MKQNGKQKRNFSSFSMDEALRWVKVENLERWEIDFQPLSPSSFFREKLKRLESFDLTSSEKAKELVIDAVCEEVIQHHSQLKIWKSAPLSTDELTGVVDYIVAPKRAYVATPLLCVIEAKKDDFEKGLGQCVIEMEACRQNNEREGVKADVYGIVSNGEGWKFYMLSVDGKVFETSLYSMIAVENVLGAVDYVFSKCEENISILLNKAA